MRSKRLLAMAAVAAMLILYAGSAGAVIPGDVDGNGRIELKDAILAMWAASGLSSAGVEVGADVNRDGVIGLAETLYDLKVLAGLAVSGTRPTGDFTNSLGMTFNLIPAGTFMMGSPEDELGAWSGEWPQHPVTLTNDFYIMTTEVTQGQWEAVMRSNPSYFTACGGECPVETVSWEDVQDFITKLNATDGRTYRLPTEAEWEYAARAGTQTAFYNGGITNTGYTPVDPNLDAIGWYYGNSEVTYTPNSSGKGTHPVGQKQPNAWGLYDMSGNVWEWCQDWYGTYPTDSVTNPTGPATASYRVLRGGSWLNSAQSCRSADRYDYDPAYRNYGNGFRLALSPSR